MKLLVCDSPEQAGLRLADIIEQSICESDSINLGLATGASSTRAYQELVRRYHRRRDLTFRYVHSFNTDEFVGLDADDPHSTRYHMNYHLFNQVDIRLENTFVMRGDAPDIDMECRAYESLIKARGGLDLVVLGLGHNGHVGFNEPGSSVKSRTRPIDLTESTLAALSDGERFHSLLETPKAALGVGLATIRESKKVVLIATGIGKADAMHRLFDCKPSPQVPASQIINHDDYIVIADRSALSRVQSSLDNFIIEPPSCK